MPDEELNRERRTRAGDALVNYAQAAGLQFEPDDRHSGDGHDTVITDLLADIMHFVAGVNTTTGRDPRGSDFEVECRLRTAAAHFRAETGDSE